MIRILAVVLAALYLAFTYFIVPALGTVERIIPGSCSPPARPAGWTGMVNDAGLAVRRASEGPPTPAQMLGWFEAAGRDARAAHVAFAAGLAGQQLRPEAPPAPPVTQAFGPDTLARALLAAGATRQEAVTLTAIAGPESGYRMDAKNPVSSAAGPWQEIAAHGTLAERTDPGSAARIAVRLARTQGIGSAWSETYGKGLHVPYIAEAAYAVNRAGDVAPVPPAAPCAHAPGTMQAGAYPQGYEQMTAALQAAFPGVRITSDLRPGAVTSSGRRSYHADGMAVDIEPSREVFDWLAATYPESSELIFTPAGDRQIKDGQTYRYGGQVVADHMGHIHWAIKVEGGTV